MRKYFVIFCFISVSFAGYTDTIERYMNIVENIPKMEMKADSDAQIWVRSARNILNLTCESIAETLIASNKAATERGKPLFCLSTDKELDPTFLNTLIQKTYTQLSAPKEVKDNMTVSEVALTGLMQQFPCASPGATAPTHSSTTLNQMMHVSE
jgi:hypothetical protein